MYYMSMFRNSSVNKLAPAVNFIDSKIKAKALVKGKVDPHLHIRMINHLINLINHYTAQEAATSFLTFPEILWFLLNYCYIYYHISIRPRYYTIRALQNLTDSTNYPRHSKHKSVWII